MTLEPINQSSALSANEKLHLVITINQLGGGGAEKVVLRLASTLVAMGHLVKVIVIRPIVFLEIPDNVEVIYVHKPNTKRGLMCVYNRRTAIKLQRMLDQLSEQKKIDAVFSNLPETDEITKFIVGYKVFHCIHSNIYFSDVQCEQSTLKRKIKIRNLRKLYDNRNLIFVSEGARQDVLEKVSVKPAYSCAIYNPFPVKEIETLAEAFEVEYQDYFIHVGRFSHVKRHDRLIEAYAKSGVENPLLLVGKGGAKESERINNLISQHGVEGKVILCGFKNNPFPYIRHAIALLLTSEFEGLPTVIVESLICGTPVISYDCPSGPKEILLGKLDEYLIAVGDSDAFADKIRQLSKTKIRISHEDGAIDRFDARTIAGQYIKAVQSVCV